MTTTTKTEGGAPEPWGKTVVVEFEDGIAWVTMDRPEKKNAINVEMAQEMAQVVDALEVDERCGVLVLTVPAIRSRRAWTSRAISAPPMVSPISKGCASSG